MKARRAIWKAFISRAHSSARTHSAFKDEEIDELAKHEMNGRQVCPRPQLYHDYILPRNVADELSRSSMQ